MGAAESGAARIGKPRLRQESAEDRHSRLLKEFLRVADLHVQDAKREQSWGPIHLILYPEDGLIAEIHDWREVRRR